MCFLFTQGTIPEWCKVVNCGVSFFSFVIRPAEINVIHDLNLCQEILTTKKVWLLGSKTILF